MKLLICLTILAFATTSTSNPVDVSGSPEQIHLSIADSFGQSYYVTWALADSNPSYLSYREKGKDSVKVPATETKFLEEGKETGRIMYIQRAIMKDLKPNTTYYYVAFNDRGTSEEFKFTTLPDNNTRWTPRLALYGDFGLSNSQSLPYLREQVLAGAFDMIIHIGDIAYNMVSNHGITGDDFFKDIQDIATTVPYMTCPGNHEYASNFSHYLNRLSMPDSYPGSPKDNFFFSFNVGPLHIISLSTEHYYFDGWYKKGIEQYNWLVNDLKEANKPENRHARPWIITLGHRPMYCSNSDSDDCTKKECRVRVGYPDQKIPGIEELLADFKVDVAMWAHEHSYERLFPIYDYKMANGSKEHPYTNPKGPVHITTGSAGCSERHDDYGDKPPYSAFRSLDYGYTILKANQTHLEISQTSDDKKGTIIDHIFVIKDEHQQWLSSKDYLKLNLSEERPGEDYLWTHQKSASRILD